MIMGEGLEYYVYILVYIDDILIIDKNPDQFMNLLRDNYMVKPSSIEELKVYLGANVNKVIYSDNSYALTMCHVHM